MQNIKNIKIKMSLLSIFFLVFSISCQAVNKGEGNSSLESAPSEPEQIAKPKNPFGAKNIRYNSNIDPNFILGLNPQSSDEEIALHALKNACKKIDAARFNEGTKKCDCENSEMAPNFVNQVCETKSLNWEGTLKTPTLGGLTMKYPQGAAEDLAYLRSQTPKVFSNVPQIFHFGFNYLAQYFQMLVGLESITDDHIFDITRQASSENLFTVPGYEKLSTVLYVDHAQNIPAALGDVHTLKPFESFWEIGENQIHFSNKNFIEESDLLEYQNMQELARSIYKVFREKQMSSEDFRPNAFAFNTHYGCLDFCLMTELLPIPEGLQAVLPSALSVSDLEFQWNRQYVTGNILNQNLMILKRSTGDRLVQIPLNYSQAPSLVLLYNIKKVRGVPTRTIGVFTPQWIPLGIQYKENDSYSIAHFYSFSELSLAKSYELAKKRQEETLKILESRKQSLPSKKAIAVIVEDDVHLPTLEKLGVLSRILIGPYLLKDSQFNSLEGSLLGWNQNISGKYKSAFSFKIDDSGIHRSWGETVGKEIYESTHSINVFQKYLKASDHHSVIPIKRLESFDEFSQWSSSVMEIGVQTINISVTRNYDAFECERRIGKIIDQSKEQFLWVIAAANEGEEGRPAYYCPMNLTSRVNTLIVAATDGNELAQYSNFGRDFADVAADGNAFYDVITDGTSFAAPIVSAVSAEIHRVYPALRPQDVKNILILGAQIPMIGELPVRSGGVVTYEDISIYLQIAQAFNEVEPNLRDLNRQMPDGTTFGETLLQEGFPDKKDFQKKLKILIKNSVIKNTEMKKEVKNAKK